LPFGLANAPTGPAKNSTIAVAIAVANLKAFGLMESS